MKKIFLMTTLTFLIIASIGFSSAADYKQHQQGKDLPISVTSNNATSCVLTTLDAPDSLVLINATLEEQSPKNFNTTIKGGNFTDLGNYCANIVCFDGVGHATGSVCKTVTTTGFTNNLGFYFLILILSWGVIIFGLWKEDAPITILGSFGLYFIGLYILFYGIDGLKDQIYTWAIGIIVLMMAAYISVKSAYELIIN